MVSVLVSSRWDIVTLKMKALRSSETKVTILPVVTAEHPNTLESLEHFART